MTILDTVTPFEALTILWLCAIVIAAIAWAIAR